MNKSLFSRRLSELRKERGYKSQYELARSYNDRFPPKRRDEAAGNDTDFRGILGTIKNYENPNHNGSPKLSTVCNLCELLDCDIDYLLGRINVPRRETSDVMAITGLTADAVYFLEDLKHADTIRCRGMLSAINALLSEAQFDDCAKYWERLQIFLFNPDAPFRALLWDGEHEFTAEDVLAILLSENEQFLRKLRRERQNG